MKNDVPIFDRKCAFDDVLARVPLTGMRVRLGGDCVTAVFSREGIAPSFSGFIPGPRGVAGWVHGLFSNMLGRPFEPSLTVKDACGRFLRLGDAVLGVTVGREGFHLLVTPGRQVYGVIGPHYRRVPKRWVHALAVCCVSTVKGTVHVEEDVDEFERVVLTYHAADEAVVEITYGNDTGCSAYEIVGRGHVLPRQWRHNRPLEELEGAVITAVREAAAPAGETRVDASVGARLRGVAERLRAAWRLDVPGRARPAPVLVEACHA